MTEQSQMDCFGSVPVQLPHSIEAEMQVLGAILIAADVEEAGARIAVAQQHGGARMFFEPVHVEIFKEVSRRAMDGMACDATAMSFWASQQDYLKDLNHQEYLVRLALSALATSQLPAYCQHLASLTDRRELLSVCDKARDALLHDETDVAHTVGEMESALASVSVTSSGRRPMSALRAGHEMFADLLADMEGDGSSRVTTGLPALDYYLPAFRGGQLVVLGGRPSMGKTALALSVALNVARAGHGVGFFSLEMMSKDIARRAVSEITSQNREAVEYLSMERNELNPQQLEAVKRATAQFADLPIQFLSRDYSDVGGLYSGAKAAQRALGGNMKLLIVDYLQLIRSSAKGRYEQMTEISIALKTLAGRLDVPILALSQLSRGVEQRDDKRPILSDLRESGQIEQDADVVMFVYRDEYYLERRKPEDGDTEKLEQWERMMKAARHRLDVIVAKQRQGRVGTAHLRCNPAINRVWDERDR